MMMVRFIFGVLLMILGIILGIYVGFFLLFIGGIIQFIEGVTASPINASDIAWGIGRFILAGPVGWTMFYVCVIPGFAVALDN